MVTFLLLNANPNQALTTDGATPLYIAAQEGGLDIVKALLANKAGPNQPRTDGWGTPLSIAAEKGYLDIVKLLLANKADPNAAARPHIFNLATEVGTTPAAIAELNGHTEIADLLHEAEAEAGEK